MANQLYALGPKDGTAIGVPLNSIPAAPLLQPAAAHYDAAKLIWLGRTHSEPYVAYVWHTAAVQSLADVMSKQLVVGATTPGTTMNDFPQLTNAVLGTKFKIVPGYASTPQMNKRWSAARPKASPASAGSPSTPRCRNGSPKRRSR